jgi:hypothetical protein
LFEPPGTTAQTARYIIDLEHHGELTSWRVLGRKDDAGEREQLDAGDNVASRAEAIEQAYDAIEADRGKLPAPIVRHGLRLAADCTKLEMMDLDTWLLWATPQVDKVAHQLAAEKRLSGAQLQRGVFASAFPECKDATPKIRASTWVQVTRRVQRIVDKELAGEFLDVYPVGTVLAARIVGMSPPRLKGRAFFHPAPDGTPYAVVVEQAGGGFRFGIWKRVRSGSPVHSGVMASETDAANAAKNWIDSLQVAVPAYNP